MLQERVAQLESKQATKENTNDVTEPVDKSIGVIGGFGKRIAPGICSLFRRRPAGRQSRGGRPAASMCPGRPASTVFTGRPAAGVVLFGKE